MKRILSATAFFYSAYFIIFSPFGLRSAIVNAENIPVVDTVITTITSSGEDTGGDGSTGVVIGEYPSRTSIYVRGQASHGDGCSYIGQENATWTAKIYRTGYAEAGEGATCGIADRNSCYSATNVSLANCEMEGDYAVDYEFGIEVESWADATDAGSPYAGDTWTTKVSVMSGGATGTLTDIFEIGSTLALEITSSTIDFGSLDLGAASADIPLALTGTGNRAIDAGVSIDGGIYCDGAGSTTIPLSNMRFSTTPETPYESKFQSTTSSINLVLDLPARTDETTAPTSTLYWQLKVPATGIGGSCTTTIVINAAAH